MFSRNYGVVKRFHDTTNAALSTLACGTCSTTQLQLGSMSSSYPFSTPLPEEGSYVGHFITINSETRCLTRMTV